MSVNTLLPLDTIIFHNGVKLRIVRRLSTSITGDIYAAELYLFAPTMPLQVVVKAMKVQDLPYVRQFFTRETETLASLMYLEDEANKEENLQIKIAPIYYGSGEYNGIPYIVMESIQGVQLHSLLQQHGKLTEQQALLIGWYLFRTLDILHTRLQKSFVDLKFDNLWWAKNSYGDEQLKLTDLGILEDMKDEKSSQSIQRDLLLASVYLCTMLTGYTLDSFRGELREPVAPVIRTYEAAISWGTRRLLQVLLHRNPARRISSAKEAALQLRQLLGYWQMEEKHLSTAITIMLTDQRISVVDSNGANQQLSKWGHNEILRAYSALDIYRRRNLDQSEIFENGRQLDLLLSPIDALSRGISLLHGNAFSLAYQTFREGIEQGENPSLLRRWSFIAKIGIDNPSIFETYFGDFSKIIDSFEIQNWDVVLERLNQLPKIIISEGLKSLKSEAILLSQLKQAEHARFSGDFQGAALYYKQAQESLHELPVDDIQFIREKEIGDISILIEEMMVLGRTRQKALSLFNESSRAIENSQFELAAQKAYDAYFSDRSDPARFTNINAVSRSLLAQALKTDENLSAAVQSAEIVANIKNWEMPIKDRSLETTWQLAHELNLAIRAAFARDGIELQRALIQCLATDDKALAVIRKVLGLAGELAYKHQDFKLLQDILTFNEKWNIARVLQVFLCHASSDKSHVRELSSKLKSYGFDSWLDEEKLLPGLNWQLEIPKAVRNSDVVIVCLSNKSINKEGYIQKEIRIALDVAEEKPDEIIFIIPAKLEECTIPDRLSKWQYVNLLDEPGFEMLIRSLNMRSKSLNLLPIPIWKQEVSMWKKHKL